MLDNLRKTVFPPVRLEPGDTARIALTAEVHNDTDTPVAVTSMLWTPIIEDVDQDVEQ